MTAPSRVKAVPTEEVDGQREAERATGKRSKGAHLSASLKASVGAPLLLPLLGFLYLGPRIPQGYGAIEYQFLRG